VTEETPEGKVLKTRGPFLQKTDRKEGAVQCRERLGGLLKYYEREAA